MGVLAVIRSNPKDNKALFIPNDIHLSAEILENIFEVDFSEVGSNKYSSQREEPCLRS